ncbi:MAG: HNH endonuclease [Candidatus Hydrogenedentes bacterium]|nr:HNH endonuclease [Candidatus Hydrogenedentota bacterium]
MVAYGNRCVISKHGPSEVLEAVHILPHAGFGINELDNGLLMRSDLLTLFDAGLIRINPDSLVVVIDTRFKALPMGN